MTGKAPFGRVLRRTRAANHRPLAEVGSIALLLTTLATTGCNAFTGLEDLEALTGAGGTADPGAVLVAADGVTITRVDIYQGPQIPLFGGPTFDIDLPVIVEREAVFRIYYKTTGDVAGNAVTARVTIGEDVTETPATLVEGTSTEGSLQSTINVTVPGEALKASSYRIDLLQPRAESSGTNKAASYPEGDAEAQEDMTVTNTGSTLKLKLIPVQYDADGSGRLPDTSEGQLQIYRNALYRMYPIPEVEVTVGDPFPWDVPIGPGGGGWDQLLDAIREHRAQSGAAPDEYYYGVFTPTETFGEFCGGGCTAGLGFVAGPGDGGMRAAIGVGFPGEGSAETCAHEVGHNHGREHAPCGTFGSNDPEFPEDAAHVEAEIGRIAYDLVNGGIIPATHKDFMSYCEPTFVSDHNYRKLAERMQQVSGFADYTPPPGFPSGDWGQVTLFSDGSLKRGATVKVSRPPTGVPRDVDVATHSGNQRVTGYFFPFDHLPGGILLYPPTENVREVAFDWAGQRHVAK